MIDQAHPQTAEYEGIAGSALVAGDTHLLGSFHGGVDTYMLQDTYCWYIQLVLQCAAQSHITM